MRTLDLWKRIVIGLAFAALIAAPIVVIMVNYNFTGPISALPLDYWLWLSVEAVVWLLVLALFRLLPRSETDILAILRRYNSPLSDMLAVAVFVALIVGGVLTGDFIPVLPAILIACVGVTALGYPKFWLGRKS